jgi:predicted nuclease with RNAse H fold
MERPYTTFLGVDLGGGKGKSTAVARLTLSEGGLLEVVEVGTTREGSSGRDPWYDESLIDYLGLHAKDAVLAIDAPLTLTACVRCTEAVCPGVQACVDPAVVWFRTVGTQLGQVEVAERDQIAAVPAGRSTRVAPQAPAAPASRKPVITPYTQRATEVVLHRLHGIMPRETLGQGMGPLTARAAHLTRALGRSGYRLNENMIEVYPKATITKLWGPEAARTYKRRADTWSTRATILEKLSGELEFAPRSRMAREQCLQSDHCFDAVMCAYTGYLWARHGWQLPEEHRDVFAVDGWIWTP